MNFIRSFETQVSHDRLSIDKWEGLKHRLDSDLDDDIKSNPILLNCLEELKLMIDIDNNIFDYFNPHPKKDLYTPKKSELSEIIKKAINDIVNDIKSPSKKPVSSVIKYHKYAQRIDVNLKALDYLKVLSKVLI